MLETSLPLIKKVIGTLGMDQAVEQVFFPTLRTIGDLWHRGEINMTGESLVSQSVRRYLAEANNLLKKPKVGPSVVVTCVPTCVLEQSLKEMKGLVRAIST